ncbi:MAG TPA: hypothetical protein DCG57_09815 [Candidatus Riflebacteria bacterium]|jgi:hypothetical protein|nr:hypothetical protein [Candidatus Riflebacteria bacterium]
MSRSKFVVAFIAGFLAISGIAQAQQWNLAYGTSKDQVAFYNSTSPGFTEDAPYGPMSFRIVKDQLWVLDSVGGRVLGIGAKNEIKTDIKISGLPKNVLLEDFALVAGSSGNPETVWVADAAECVIRKLSLANGRELVKIGGNGSEPGKFLQINQLEVDRGGRLYVGDIGRQLVAVFTPYGELVREMPCQRSGFAIDASGNLHMIDYRENYGHLHRTYSPKGQLLRTLHLGMSKFQNPRIWGVNGQGGLLVSFIPEEGFKGQLKMFEFAGDASVLRRSELAPGLSMNRFVVPSDRQLWLAVADFASAPAGQFSIKSIDWDVK